MDAAHRYVNGRRRARGFDSGSGCRAAVGSFVEALRSSPIAIGATLHPAALSTNNRAIVPPRCKANRPRI